MIFSTCVILICLCRRNLQLLKCWSLLNTWSCTILRLPCSVLYGGAEKWCGEGLRLPTSWILMYLSTVHEWAMATVTVRASCVPLSSTRTIFFSHWSLTTYQNILRVSELVGPHLLSFMWLSVRVLQHVLQHILEGSEGVCSEQGKLFFKISPLT